MNIVFMGTPDFALPTLKQLHESTHNVQLVVTQPDRPKGRGRESTPPPVKQFAVENGLPILQLEKSTNPKVVQTLSELNADIFIVVAFGEIQLHRFFKALDTCLPLEEIFVVKSFDMTLMAVEKIFETHCMRF